jgi:SAM-dependent methyltransferase
MTACPLCLSDDAELMMTVPDANFSRRIAKFDVLACRGCDTARMAPWPERSDVEEIYVRENVFSTTRANPFLRHPLAPPLEWLYARLGADLRFIVRECLKAVGRRDNISILDIGCSTGVLLKTFLKAAPNAEVQGIDLDPGAKARALPGLSDRIVIGEFIEFRPERKYDIVSLRFVLEHLLEPMKYLKHAVSLLKPGGILFIAVPDITSPQARQQGAEWELMNDKRMKIGHVTWYSRRSIERIAAQLGLTVVSCRNRGEAIYHLPRRVQQFARAVLGTEPTRKRFIRFYTLRLLNASFVDGVLAEGLGIGDKLYATLRKP